MPVQMNRLWLGASVQANIAWLAPSNALEETLILQSQLQCPAVQAALCSSTDCKLRVLLSC